MKEFYLIYRGIRYIISYSMERRIIEKEENNRRIPLTEEDQGILNTLFAHRKKDVFYSTKLDEILSSNSEVKEIEELIKLVEEYIPEEYRENYYENLKELTIVYFDEDEEEYSEIKNNSALYNSIENTIFLNKKYFDLNPQNFNATMVHELLHVASLDKKNPNFYTEHYGFVEGFSELYAHYILNDGDETTYPIQVSILNQLIISIGLDNVKKAYFSHSMYPIINALYENGFSKADVNILLDAIDVTYQIDNSKENIQSDVLAVAQTILIESFIRSASDDIDRMSELIRVYDKCLIKPDSNLKEVKSYTNLDKNVAHLNYLKNYVKVYYGNNALMENYAENGLEELNKKLGGYSKIGLIGILTTLISIGIIILGTFITR